MHLLAATAFAQSANDLDRAEELVGRALQRVRELDDDFGHGTALALLANIAAGRGDVARAIELYRRARDMAKRRGGPFGEALILTNLGLVLAESGDLASARAGLEDAADLLEATGDVWFRAYVLMCLSQLMHQGGDRVGGHELALRSAELWVDHGGGPELAETLEHLADLAADHGAAAVGVQLHGAAQRARDDSGAQRSPSQRRAIERRRHRQERAEEARVRQPVGAGGLGSGKRKGAPAPERTDAARATAKVRRLAEAPSERPCESGPYTRQGDFDMASRRHMPSQGWSQCFCSSEGPRSPPPRTIRSTPPA
jgi:tetratricopeptide (TPR) repeat protein